MKPPIIGTKVHGAAIDSLIDALETIVDADASFYVGYPVARQSRAPLPVPAALLISLSTVGMF